MGIEKTEGPTGGIARVGNLLKNVILWLVVWEEWCDWFSFELAKKKNKLIFSLDLKNNRNSVSDLFKDLIKNSISFYDVEIKKNNLEEIFLKLIDQWI